MDLAIKAVYIKVRHRLGLPVSFRLGKIALAVFLPAVIGAAVLTNQDSPTPTTSADANQPRATSLPLNQTPEFGVLTPRGQGPPGPGGFAKVGPPGSTPTYVFVDKVDGIDIRLSQQQLPSRFKTSPAELEKLAKGLNATRSLDAVGTKVFAGTNLNGQQSLVFQKENLLVLVSSDEQIADQSWAEYISGLSR